MEQSGDWGAVPEGATNKTASLVAGEAVLVKGFWQVFRLNYTRCSGQWPGFAAGRFPGLAAAVFAA